MIVYQQSGKDCACFFQKYKKDSATKKLMYIYMKDVVKLEEKK